MSEAGQNKPGSVFGNWHIMLLIGPIVPPCYHKSMAAEALFVSSIWGLVAAAVMEDWPSLGSLDCTIHCGIEILRFSFRRILHCFWVLT